MDDARYEGPDEWMAAVHRALARADAHPILAAKGIDRETVLAVARREVSEASDRGISILTHARLARLTGMPRSTVLRARLALTELGLEGLASAPAAHGQVHRVLLHR